MYRKMENGSDGPANTQLREAFHTFLSAFEQFKQANDDRLSQIEGKMAADVLTAQKVDRINAALAQHQSAIDEMVLSAKRPHLGTAGVKALDTHSLQHKAAWDAYARKGDASQLHTFESKSLSAGSDPDGGYLVPKETEKTIDRVLSEASPIRSIATVRQVSSTTFKKPITTTGAASGWVGETASRTETNGAHRVSPYSPYSGGTVYIQTLKPNV